jgi:hypothetical protein
VARAKRTARADARRRYRAEHAALEDASPDETPDPVAGDPSASKSSRKPATTNAAAMPGGRIGIGAAFRLAFRPLDVRGDLAALPGLAIHSKALWLPALLVVASTVAFAITGGKDIVTQFMFAYFIQTPAIGSVFLAGFLAPRASWLLGVIVGLISAVCYTVIILIYASSVSAFQPVATEARDAIIAGFVLSPVMGAFFAAAAAWYRRFLQLSSPNRGRSASAKPKQNDGRTRSTGSQKANARR